MLQISKQGSFGYVSLAQCHMSSDLEWHIGNAIILSNEVIEKCYSECFIPFVLLFQQLCCGMQLGIVSSALIVLSLEMTLSTPSISPFVLNCVCMISNTFAFLSMWYDVHSTLSSCCKATSRLVLSKLAVSSLIYTGVEIALWIWKVIIPCMLLSVVNKKSSAIHQQ